VADETIPEIYLFHVWIREISPMIGRRLLVRSDSSLAALHDNLQISLILTDFHINLSITNEHDYGVGRLGGLGVRQSSEQRVG
jgi:pRiA4b ORF-3-like protein